MTKVSPLSRFRRATVLDVRRANRTVLLRHLFFGGSLSRHDLVDATGLSSGTVTSVVASLMDEGLVVEAGTRESDGGRPQVLLEIAGDRAVAIGVDAGETRVRVEAFDCRLRKLGSQDRLVGNARQAPDIVVGAIADAIEILLPEVGRSADDLAGVGVGVSGIVDDNGLVHSPSIGWKAVPFVAMLRERIAAPIRVDNGAKTMGQAEMWFGAGRGARHAVVALLGTGVGAAVFTDGMLYRGAFSSAGEWGHVPLVLGGELCRCGASGCLEAYIGAGAITRRWSAVRGLTDPGEENAIRDLGEALSSDAKADALADRLVDELGAGLATLVNLFNPERIVIAGWVGLALGPALLERIRDRTRAHALERPFEQVELVLGELGADAVALGAATLVVEEIISGDLPVPPRAGEAARGARSARPPRQEVEQAELAHSR